MSTDLKRLRRDSDVLIAQHPGRELRFDLVLPAGHPGPRPLVVWIHGGAWLRGNRKRLPERFDQFTDRGVALASIEYRLSHEATFPAQLFDVRAAIRHLRHHCGGLGLDPDAIGLWGASAGAHLAALAGLLGHRELLPGEGEVHGDVSVRAVAAAYGPSDLTCSAPPPDATIPGLTGPDSPEARLLGGAPVHRPDIAHAASPLHHVRPDAPPFQLCHGTADPLVSWRHSWNLHAALTAVGVRSELYLLDGYRHGFVNAPRRGDVDVEDLLDGGGLAVESPAPALHYTPTWPDGEPAAYSFEVVGEFFAHHLAGDPGEEAVDP
jgi:acetyl esterase/lipase